jgi:hypothetical protein
LIDDDTINHLSDSPTALNAEAQSPTVQESEVNRYKTSSNRELPIITPTNKDQKPTTGNISLNTSTVTIPTDQPKNNLASPSTPLSTNLLQLLPFKLYPIQKLINLH